MKKLIVLGLVCCFVAMALMGCGAQKAAEGDKPLIVGGDGAYKPFEFRNDKNEITGFDVDLINAIAEEAGYKVEYQDTAWDGIIPALLNKKIDIIASAMTITEERKKSIAFTDPYFDSGQAIAVAAKNADTLKQPADLAGKKIGVQINATGDLAATEKLKDAKEIKRFNVIPDAFVALENDQVQAVVADVPVVFEYNQSNPGKIKILDNYLTIEQFGFGLRLEDKELKEKMNAALKKLKENGKYDEIFAKWFGEK